MSRCRVPLWLLPALMAAAAPLCAEIVSDVANTKHNLSVSGPGTATAVSDTEICVFCHTPHGATAEPGVPLWNRQLSPQTYTVYTSSSLDAETIQGALDQPGGSSKLCLSCHDGTLALGAVNVRGGQTNVTIDLSGTAGDGSMPAGEGTQTGFTRDLGTDLTNDHPISLTYDTTLAQADTELRDPDSVTHIDLRRPGVKPPIPLEGTGTGGDAQIQCASCHDPHVRDTDGTLNIKFLRLNRFQQVEPSAGAFNQADDIVCLGCHDKDGWETSAHAVQAVANETYNATEAALREFPNALPVWQAACLNCHDTHTVSGSRRLLREGTDSPASPKSGGNSAIEETCYQCHSAAPVISNAAAEVKDIASDFALPRRMPITGTDQIAETEVHDIVDDDFTESQLNLGKGNADNRHAECTDCHNPHRVMRNSLFNGNGNSAQATHDLGTNIASGALRGTWGVEPQYGSAPFLTLPLNYVVKQGDGGLGASTAVASNHVTREYQICIKCHSDYGYTDTGAYPDGGRPNLGDSGGGTPPGTNDLDQYTNQAMEFQAPAAHKGEVTTSDSGAGAGFTSNNHRSWHPVIDDTGRTAGVRNASASAWLAPWNAGVGTQTMHCSDCHGSNTANDSVVPTGNNPWGPHGSQNDFILKGTWDNQTGGQSREVPATDPNNGLCFKCHDFRTYADRDGDDINSSGFSGEESNNLHAFHADKIERLHCTWCHVAVPHGWKNKALLVNLNDVGPEAGPGFSGTEVPINSSAQTFTQGPYYLEAKLKVINFRASGTWRDQDCGSASGNPDVGRDWMRDVCENPP